MIVGLRPRSSVRNDHAARQNRGATTMESDSRRELEEARRLLGECVLFQGLGPDDRGGLVAHAHVRKLAAGKTIFLMDAPGDSMMAVLSGSVRISVPSPDGKEIMLAIMQPGEFFGEMALLA